MTNSSIKVNSATNNGGGVYNNEGIHTATMNLINTMIYWNSENNGGGIYIGGGLLEKL